MKKSNSPLLLRKTFIVRKGNFEQEMTKEELVRFCQFVLGKEAKNELTGKELVVFSKTLRVS